VARTGQSIQYADVPYDGFLQTRGRTYWKIAVSPEVLTAPASASCTSPTGETWLFITIEDVTQNAALQPPPAAQELERARMEQLIKHLPSGVMLISPDKTITLINHSAVQILQTAGAALEPYDDLDQAVERTIGLDCDALTAPLIIYDTSNSVVPYEERPLARALYRGEQSGMEFRIVSKEDGHSIYLHVHAAPLLAADGTITNAVLVLQEITNLKALEHAREDFFTTMAHELKTPLANIRAHLSAVLASDLQWSKEKQQEFLQTADEQVERLVGMINSFLDASRVEAGALRLELEPILLPEMLEDLQERLEALISSSHRVLQLLLPARLPAVLADYELIMSVLTNLLSNALRYAPEGDTVYLEAKLLFEPGNRHPSCVMLSVTDHGPGMTLEQQKVLFTRFSTFAAMNRPAIDRPGQPTMERGRGTAHWGPATGLGLYISRGVIEAHGSELTLKSSPGQGATFAFALPVAPTKHEQALEEEQNNRASAL
jgi:signal transduction histidine kinase